MRDVSSSSVTMRIAVDTIQLVSPNELKANPRNPNTHTEEQIKRLCKVITEQGFRVPIVVSKQSGKVVAGHGRLQASLKLGLEKVPVSFQDFASEAQENTHMLADNRLAELADMDNTMLKDLLQELDTGEIDMDLTGFSESEIGSLMTQVFQGDDTGDDPTDKLEVMQNTQLRQIMLVYKQEEFEEIIDLLEELKSKMSLETNHDVITQLIRDKAKQL